MNQHLKQAIAAARAGKEAQAKVLLARVVKEEPDNVNAWYLLSSLADTEEQKIHHLEKVLELQPGHAAASQQLAELVPAIPEPAEDLPVFEEPEVDATPEMFPLPEVDLPEADTAPEDPDEAMAWLERLAADQGAPMNELPTMFEADDDFETADNLFDTPEFNLPDDLEEYDLGEYEEEDTAPEDPDEAMAWLERLAADQGAPMDELPSLTENEDKEEDETFDTFIADLDADYGDLGEYEEEDTAPEDPDEAMAWLERLAADQGAPMDELPTMFEEDEDDDSETADALFADLTADFDEEYEEEDTAPEDPDEAMAWLERLAADQGAPMDELPTMFEEDEDDDSETADTLFADLTADFDEEYEEEDTAPEDPDDAMAWLEQLAADQGAPMDELPTMFEEDAADDLTDDDFSWLEGVDEDDSSYLESLPTLVNEEEEAEETEEEPVIPAKTLTVSDDPFDIIGQAEGDTIPSWLADDEDLISADTLVTMPAQEKEKPAEPENLPDWLNELPDEEWTGDEAEKSGQVVWKAGEGDDSKKPELSTAKEKRETRSARQTAKAKDNTTQLALLFAIAIILIFAILYLLIVQPL